MFTFIKNDLTNKGYTFKSLSWINAQIDLLDELIQIESINVLNELLHKTNYRLLKCIDKGADNLVDIANIPEQWKLGKIEDNELEWLNKEALIFSTERQTLVFSKVIDGQAYTNNKWQ
jgi:hypothetical protein